MRQSVGSSCARAGRDSTSQESVRHFLLHLVAFVHMKGQACKCQTRLECKPRVPEDAHHLNFTVGRRVQIVCAMLPGPPTRWGWWTHLPQDDELTRAELQSIPNRTMRDRVLTGGWHPPIEALVSNTKQIMGTPIYGLPSLPAWHLGGQVRRFNSI